MDARHHARSRVALQKTDGVFLLKADNQQFRLHEVDNVSASGTGLRLPLPLRRNTPVTLTYTASDLHLTIRGTVVWSEPKRPNPESDTAGYRLGIQFDPTNADDNTLFFLALREFLDPFTWAS